ncbi:MAG: hypothetical protein H0W88_09425 [Parachlamydiaceae bacterium]|nr:hypothetical protein [Parachlamydiaceae bacterium]
MSDHCHKRLQEVLDKNPSCYVLITCGEPSEDGKMNVEMTYQGDVTLASYLLQGAQTLIDHAEEQELLNSEKTTSLHLYHAGPKT